MPSYNFVKFQRGSEAAYESLKNNNRLESDALYFVYDRLHPEEGGLLYLGEVLIGGAGNGSSISALNDLSDVSAANPLNGVILQYQSSSQSWTTVSPTEILPIVDSGSQRGTETVQQTLTRIDSTPLEGDIVFVDNVPYIYNGTTWQLLVGQDMEDRVTAIETTLQSIDGRIAEAIADANHLSYQVVQSLPAVENADNNVVYLVRNNESTGDNLYDEYMLVGNNLEKIGGFTANLNNYVTTNTFNSTVGDLQDSIANLESNFDDYVTLTKYGNEIGDISDLRTETGDNTITVIDEIINIDGRLRWNELNSGG